MKALARHWFLIAVALIMLAPAAAMVARAIPLKGPQRFSIAKLAGVTPAAEPIAPSLDALRSGALQAGVAAALTERMGQPREFFIRANNGIAYALGRSTVPSIVIGRDRMLYETTYIDDWCGRGTPIDAEAQAARIARIAAAVRRAGKAFVFIVSPSKVALYPDGLPEPCIPAATRDYDRLLAALARHDVPVVDGHVLAHAAKASQNLPVFNRDGIHWNDISVYPAIRGLFDQLGAQLATPPRQLALSHVDVDRWPFDDEDDLARLLNLPVTLPVYPSPHGRFTASPEGTPPRLMVVGSSFMWQFLRILSLNTVLGDSKFYFYFSRIVDFRDGGVYESKVPFQAAPDLPKTFPQTDAVILEANETALGSPHIAAFEQALAALTGTGEAGRLPDP